MNGGRAQILAVQKAIQAREECIKQIRQIDQDELQKMIDFKQDEQYAPNQEFLNEMATLI